jgi:flagellar basal-body rod protein FlgC
MINLLTGASATSSALNAERIRMEVISQNIANVNTTRDVNGKPYERKQVIFESALKDAVAGQTAGEHTVQVARVESDKRGTKQVYCPGHPLADENNMVEVPNINIHEEMADLISSSRAFEANLAVLKNARQMAIQTLSIGKH